MFSAINQAIIAFCTGIITFASVFNRSMTTIDNVVRVAEQESEAYLERTTIERQHKLIELRKSLPQLEQVA